MIYVGVVGELLDIDPAEMEVALTKQFKGKAKAIALNKQALEVGTQVRRRSNLDRSLVPYRCQRMDATKGKIIIDGNAAAALGCMFAGITVATWYPITPSSSLCETLADYMHDYRIEAGRQSDLRDRSGGRRTGGDRHGDRRRMGGSPLHDVHGRARASR